MEKGRRKKKKDAGYHYIMHDESWTGFSYHGEMTKKNKKKKSDSLKLHVFSFWLIIRKIIITR